MPIEPHLTGFLNNLYIIRVSANHSRGMQQATVEETCAAIHTEAARLIKKNEGLITYTHLDAYQEAIRAIGAGARNL